MKTTLDLPDDLVMEIKLRAVREGRKLKDAVADLLRRGMAAPPEPVTDVVTSIIRIDKTTGLPVIVPQFPPTVPRGLSPQQLADILLEQEAMWNRDAGR